MPVTTVAAKRAACRSCSSCGAAPWSPIWSAAGCIMWLIMTGFPEAARTDRRVGRATSPTAPLSAQSVALAVLGGMAITLMTRMQHGTDSMPGKIAAAVAGAFLLAGLQLFHSILDSLLIFGASPPARAVRLPRLARLVRLHPVRQCVRWLGPCDAAAAVAQQGPAARGARGGRGLVSARTRNQNGHGTAAVGDDFFGITDGQAFNLLVSTSKRANIKLHDLAARLLAEMNSTRADLT